MAHYADKGQPAHIEETEGKFLVKRTADNKVGLGLGLGLELGS